MHRFTRTWLRSPRVLPSRVPSFRALQRSSAGTAVAVSDAGVRASQTQTQLLAVRCFQTTSISLQRDVDHDTTSTPKPSDEGDSDSNSDSDSEIEEEEDKLEELEEEDDDEAFEGEVDEEAVAAAARYIGVVYSPQNVKKYSAELELDGIVISGGDFWTALDAAKGYDELVDLYCDLDTARNFPAGSDAAEAAAGAASASSDFASSASETEWAIPEVGKRNADMIPPIRGAYLTLDEVLAALEREKAIDVYTVDLAGKSSLADYMIFTTGRSQAHMRRMADMMIQSMKARQLDDEFDYAVEGRDCDDWMIADCNNVVVHFMRDDTRRILKLEDHWENMVNDKHKILGDMDEDEYMDRFGTSELMEYLDDEDFTSVDDTAKYDAEVGTERKDGRRGGSKSGKGSDIDWK